MKVFKTLEEQQFLKNKNTSEHILAHLNEFN